MPKQHSWKPDRHVSLFTREWIEIDSILAETVSAERLPLYEGVD